MRHENELYRFRVRGHLGRHAGAWFGHLVRHLRVTETADGDTQMIVAVPDQTSLHGLLRKVRDLGLTLEEVIRLRHPAP